MLSVVTMRVRRNVPFFSCHTLKGSDFSVSMSEFRKKKKEKFLLHHYGYRLTSADIRRFVENLLQRFIKCYNNISETYNSSTHAIFDFTSGTVFYVRRRTLLFGIEVSKLFVNSGQCRYSTDLTRNHLNRRVLAVMAGTVEKQFK